MTLALNHNPVLNGLETLLPVFKALSDPTRLQIMQVLMQDTAEQLTVTDLVDATQLPQSTVSRHLAILKAAGIATVNRNKTTRNYQIHLAAESLEAFELLVRELRKCSELKHR